MEQGEKYTSTKLALLRYTRKNFKGNLQPLRLVLHWCKLTSLGLALISTSASCPPSVSWLRCLEHGRREVRTPPAQESNGKASSHFLGGTRGASPADRLLDETRMRKHLTHPSSPSFSQESLFWHQDISNVALGRQAREAVHRSSRADTAYTVLLYQYRVLVW